MLKMFEYTSQKKTGDIKKILVWYFIYRHVYVHVHVVYSWEHDS